MYLAHYFFRGGIIFFIYLERFQGVLGGGVERNPRCVFERDKISRSNLKL